MSLITHQVASSALAGGVVREDVMAKIWDISNIPLPFTDLIGTGSHTNRYAEWTEDTLAAPKTDNATVDGADITVDNSTVGTRLGNCTQIATKRVSVSEQAAAADSIANQAKLSYQLSQRQKELRRDVEAQMLTLQASVLGDGNTVAGISAGIGAQLKTNISLGATGVAGGFNTTTKLFVSPTNVGGTKRALSETLIRDILQKVYQEGGNTLCAMARPPVIRKLSEYLFGTTARVANIQSEAKGNRATTAYGAVNVFVTDFGQTIELRDNRIQPTDAAGTSSMYFLDPAHLEISYMKGYRVSPLAKTGLSEKRMMAVDYALKVLNEKSQGVIYAIDETLSVVA